MRFGERLGERGCLGRRLSGGCSEESSDWRSAMFLLRRWTSFLCFKSVDLRRAGRVVTGVYDLIRLLDTCLPSHWTHRRYSRVRARVRVGGTNRRSSGPQTGRGQWLYVGHAGIENGQLSGVSAVCVVFVTWSCSYTYGMGARDAERRWAADMHQRGSTRSIPITCGSPLPR